MKDVFYVIGVHGKQTPTVDSESKQFTIAIQERGKSLFNESSTRILVSHLHQRIQEEKIKFPKDPFKKEFLVVSFTTDLCLCIDNMLKVKKEYFAVEILLIS